MGDVGALGSGFGTGSLHARPSAPRGGAGATTAAHRSLRARAAGAVFALACSGACGGGATSAPGGDDPTRGADERAAALLDRAASLPPRAEVVLLADALQIESSRQGKTPAGAALARRAADLRARAWRLDQTQSDAREAIELYGAAAAAAAGADLGCEADLQRALLAGELARDAAVGYREIYLAARRQKALGGKDGDAGRAGCLASLDRALAHAVAFRPSGDAMRALERDGNAAADAALRGAPAAAAAAAPPPPASPPRAAPPPAGGAGAPAGAPPSSGPEGDLVVSPREETLAKGPVKVASIERYAASDKGARIVIHLSAPAAFKVGVLPADGDAGKDARIFVDIAEAKAKGIPREIAVGGAVRRVRVGAQPSGTRVVLDLAAALHRRVFYLPDPFRIVVDVTSRPTAAAEPTPGGAREVRRVAIDAGHGGYDDGAVGPTGLREKDVTLDIAHRVAPLLAHELKVETLLTRDSDSFVPLDARTARANAFHADLFVSIHCNASADGMARGPMTFIIDDRGSGAYVGLAARENAPRAKGAAAALDAQAVDAQMASILSSLNVGEMAARSRHVAELLQRSAVASLAGRYADTKDQGVKTAGFFVLAGTDMPAVLFETSFISNPEDEARLATADYRQKMADAIANAIKAYRDGK